MNITIGELASTKELTAIACFLFDSTDSRNPVFEYLCLQLANHPNVDLKTWGGCFEYFPNADIWDNPVLEFLVIEEGLHELRKLYPHSQNLKKDLSTKSNFYKVCLKLFSEMEAQEKEAEEAEERRKNILIEEELKFFPFKIGDGVRIKNISYKQSPYLIERFEAFTLSSKEEIINACLRSFDGTSSTSRRLSELEAIEPISPVLVTWEELTEIKNLCQFYDLPVGGKKGLLDCQYLHGFRKFEVEGQEDTLLIEMSLYDYKVFKQAEPQLSAHFKTRF